MIRILVADDSATARALIIAILASEPDFRVVGEAADGNSAVEMATRLSPDLVTMDVQMPGMDGLAATKHIMRITPRPIIIISSVAREADVGLSLEATRAGALMVLPKPEGPQSARFEAQRRQIVSMVRAMAAVKVVRRHDTGVVSAAHGKRIDTPASIPVQPRAGAATSNIRLVAIGASTGGPAALRTILAELPASFPVPIIVVQHIATGFTRGLAHWLAGDTALTVKLGELGEPAVAGTVYFAPDDRHIGARVDPQGQLRIVIDAAAPVGAFRPSATYLFRAAAEAVGRDLVAVILTGMGDDGTAGLRTAHSLGAHVIAQDEKSCVIYGMPREAVRSGAVTSVLPLAAIASSITGLVS